MSGKVDRLLSQFGLLNEDERREFFERWETADVFSSSVVPGSFENIKARLGVLYEELTTIYQDSGQLSEGEQDALDEILQEKQRAAYLGITEYVSPESDSIFQMRSEFCTWVSTRVRFN